MGEATGDPVEPEGEEAPGGAAATETAKTDSGPGDEIKGNPVKPDS